MGVAGCMCRRAWGTARGHLITTIHVFRNGRIARTQGPES